ncbi:hypothetical protein [Solimonas soli]|uniref:hypothetical protein n=1 Tax=Solimonas soli TaxID=413479 RepID=UPI0004BB7F67|nr:hypothetical protein [Solimonas soli]
MLKIAAASRHVARLADTPDDLRARLQGLGVSVRRVNRFIELALLGAVQCRDDLGAPLAADAALYLAAETPMLADCVKALRATLAEQRPPTPFEFMNISGNMAGFYIAQQLGVGGPQLAVSRRGDGLAAAFELLLPQHRRHRRALVGGVEEGVWPLHEQRARLGLAADAVLHESSHWFYVDADCARPRVIVEAPRRHADRAAVHAALSALPDDALLALHPDLDADALDLPRKLRLAPRAALPGQGAAAEALHGYLAAPAQGPWFHLSRDGDGSWHVLAARKPR